MKIVRLCAFVLTFISLNVSAEINLNIKIGQIINSKKVETIKIVSVRFNQDTVVLQPGSKNKIVINLKKIENIIVNGNSINPVQIDIKMIDSKKKTIGEPQTSTSFYNNEAHFNIRNKSYSDGGEVSVRLKFQET